MKQPVIIGGGLAGGAAAVRLAQCGAAPLLLERIEGAHDKICGEFLSGEATAHLSALGFSVERLGGERIDTVRLHRGRHHVRASLPFFATGLRRRTLDAALLEHAAAAGAQVTSGVRVHRIVDGRAVTDAGTIDAGPLLLATGKHPLPGERREGRGVVEDLVGFKQYFHCTPSLRRLLQGTVVIVAFAGGYAGVQLVDGDLVNLCLLVARDALALRGGSWPSLFASLLQEPALEPLAEAVPLLPRPLTISGVPYGYLANANVEDHVYRLGDQAAVIPSFCGDGMAIALHSGRLAGDAVAAGWSAPVFQAQLRQDVARQVQLAMHMQRLARTTIGQWALLAGFAAVPGALRLMARLTRVSAGAVERTIGR